MALPEKDLYRLADCADRWKCAIEDVVDYLEMGLIIPVVRHPSIVVELWKHSGSWGDEGPDWPDDGEVVDMFPIEKGWAWLPLFRIQEVYGSGPSEFLRLSQCLLSDRPRDTSKLMVLARDQPDEKFPVVDLRIPKREFDAFDAYVKNHPRLLGTRERLNLMRQIGVLTRILINSPPDQILVPITPSIPASIQPQKWDLGSVDKPNITKIAELLLDHMRASKLSNAGLSDTVIRDRTKEAFELLVDDLIDEPEAKPNPPISPVGG